MVQLHEADHDLHSIPVHLGEAEDSHSHDSQVKLLLAEATLADNRIQQGFKQNGNRFFLCVWGKSHLKKTQNHNHLMCVQAWGQS